MIGQAHPHIRRTDLLEALRYLRIDSVFKMIDKTCVVLAHASLAIGIYASWPPAFALAAVNESLHIDNDVALDYIANISPNELSVFFLVNDHNVTYNQLRAYYTILYNNTPDLEYSYSNDVPHQGDQLDGRKEAKTFDKSFAPETVWSLDASPREPTYGEFRSDLDIDVGYSKMARLGTRELFDPWTNDTVRDSDIRLAPPPQFQVADCNGLAERPDLDRCKPGDTNPYGDQSAEQRLSNNNDHDGASNNSSTVSSNAEDQQHQFDITQNVYPFMAASVSELVVADGSSISELCADVSVCPIIGTWYLDYWRSFGGEINSLSGSVNPPIASVGFTITSIGSTTRPDLPPPVTSDGGSVPGSGLILGSTPPIVSSTVPETSTWIMIMMGFSIIVVAGKRRAIHSVKRAVTGAVLKLTKRSFRHDTA